MENEGMIPRSLSIRWCFNTKRWTPSKEAFIQAMVRIQPEERERANSFLFRKDAKPALIGRLMMRYCLCKMLGLQNGDLALDRTPKGKPIIGDATWKLLRSRGAKTESNPTDANSKDRRDANLTNPTGGASVPPVFDFNVSHQGDYVALAFDTCSKVGVDTMQIVHEGSELSVFFDRMKRQFSSSEWSFILGTDSSTTDSSTTDSLPTDSSLSVISRGNHGTKSSEIGNDQLFRFMRLWSLKESYVKAEGFGITIDLQSTSFTCPTTTLQVSTLVSDTVLQVNGQFLSGWRFQECLLDPDHCVSVALQQVSNTEEESKKGKVSNTEVSKTEVSESGSKFPGNSLGVGVQRLDINEEKVQGKGGSGGDFGEREKVNRIEGDGPERGEGSSEGVSGSSEGVSGNILNRGDFGNEKGRGKIFREIPLEEMINNLDPLCDSFSIEKYWIQFEKKKERPN